MPWLTKSRFTSGLQCPKRLWNEVHEPLEQPMADTVAFVNGRQIDQLVQKLQPGVVVSRDRGHAGRHRRDRAADAPGRSRRCCISRPSAPAIGGDCGRAAALGTPRDADRSEILDGRKAGAHLPMWDFRPWFCARPGCPSIACMLAHVDGQLRAATRRRLRRTDQRGRRHQRGRGGAPGYRRVRRRAARS